MVPTTLWLYQMNGRTDVFAATPDLVWIQPNTVQLLNAVNLSACFDLHNQFVSIYAEAQHFIEMSLCYDKENCQSQFSTILTPAFARTTPKRKHERWISGYGGFIIKIILDKLLAAVAQKIPEVFPRLSSTCSWQNRQTLTGIQTGLEMVSKQHFS